MVEKLLRRECGIIHCFIQDHPFATNASRGHLSVFKRVSSSFRLLTINYLFLKNTKA